jgi:hypothetical protein
MHCDAIGENFHQIWQANFNGWFVYWKFTKFEEEQRVGKNSRSGLNLHWGRSQWLDWASRQLILPNTRNSNNNFLICSNIITCYEIHVVSSVQITLACWLYAAACQESFQEVENSLTYVERNIWPSYCLPKFYCWIWKNIWLRHPPNKKSLGVQICFKKFC